MGVCNKGWVALAFAICLGIPTTASTQSISAASAYPERLVRIIVPATAGSGPDVETRQFATQLSQELGQVVIVENHPGNAGLIGLDLVAKARPDGYTLGAATISTLATNPRLFQSPPFDVERDLVPISLLGKHPYLLYVNSAFPAKSLSEFIGLAKAKPGTITYSAAIGNFQHLAAEWFQTLTGTKLRIVPYGASGWQNDLLGGHVDATFYPMVALLPHVRSGALRALAVTGTTRSPLLPDVPTFGEAGLPEFEAYAWFGIVAPAGVPGPTQLKLSTAAMRAAQSPEFRQFLSGLGGIALGTSSSEFRDYQRAERIKWKKIIDHAGVKLE